MDKQTDDSLNHFKDEIKKVALKDVLTKFPEKITELNSLLNDEKFQNGFDVSKDEFHILGLDSKEAKEEQTSDTDSESSDQSSEVDTTAQVKSVKTRNVVVPSNRYLLEMVALLRPQMIEFVDHTLQLSAAINLLMPAIEDGNNFGVEIQQECVDTIITAENDVYHRMLEIYKYFSNRADLVTKAIKNPKCEDFVIAVQEKDRMFHKYLVISLNAVRNYYMNLHDLVQKNLDKIKKPKTRVSCELLY